MFRQMNKSEKEHLNAIANLGCVICSSPACIHHLRHGMGMGQRNNHYNVIPLCFLHHQGKEGIHTLGTKTWQKKYGSETDLLTKVNKQLQEVNQYGDYEFPIKFHRQKEPKRVVKYT